MDATRGDEDRPRRARFFWVKRSEYERVRTQLAEAQARDRARDERLEVVLGDAEALTAQAGRAVTAIAALLGAEWPDDLEGSRAEDLVLALRALLPRRAADVQALRAEQLSEAQRVFLAARTDGSATWQLSSANAAGEPHLDVTAAVAGERAVLVRYAEGIHDDGSLSEIVECVCRAAAASLAARDLARERGRRLPLSLLGDETAARRFAALRETQQQEPLERVTVALRAGERERGSGVYGEPAWQATLFDLAVELDLAARAVGGEAFETGSGFVCLAPAGAIPALRADIAEILKPIEAGADLAIADLAAA
jgi:hypothetical protein